MRITILIDNRHTSGLESEHGLCLFVETTTHKILVDTGLSGKAFDNAEKLGININDVDLLLLSHGHIDHTGGLRRFLEINQKAKIIASHHIPDTKYWSNRGGKFHSLSPDEELIRNYINRFILITDNYVINNDIGIIIPKKAHNPKPQGNRYLFVSDGDKMIPYTASDELALSVVEDGRLVIISPCSHQGLLNIADNCCNAMNCSYIAAFVGGLHLLDGESDDVTSIASQINLLYPQMHLYTSHCTGRDACTILQEGFKDRFHVFTTGEGINIGSSIH